MIETISHVNRDVAKSLHVEEKLVKSINSFYWREGVRDSISSGDYTSIWMRGIGTFVASRFKVNRAIRKVIALIRRYRVSPKTLKGKSTEVYLDECLGQLRNLLKRRNDIATIYKMKEDQIRLIKSHVKMVKECVEE